MRMTAIRIQTERKQQEKSVRRTEKHPCRARMLSRAGPIRPFSIACATSGASWGPKHLSGGQVRPNSHQSARHMGNVGLRWIAMAALVKPAAPQNTRRRLLWATAELDRLSWFLTV
jgi:hypothetical protein